MNRDYGWPENKWKYLVTLSAQDAFSYVPLIELGNFNDISVLESDLVEWNYAAYGWQQTNTCVRLMIKCNVPGGFTFQ